MRILVIGAGVLGCNIAANLFRAGKDVTLLARGAWGKTIAKLAVGLIFLVTAFSMEETDTMLVGLVIALAIIAWGLIPLLRSWLAFRSSQERRQEAERQRRAAARQRQNTVRTCPNCGASTKGPICEYCGSPLG